MHHTLIIARHAKSSRDDTFFADHDRPLHPKGKKHLKAMQQWLQQQHLPCPDCIMSSTACRALTTAQAYAKTRGYKPKHIVQSESLFMANLATLIKQIETTEEACQTLCLVGHNNGLTDLIHACGSDRDLLPTCGIVVFRYTGKFWGNFEPARCKEIARGEPQR